MFCIYEVRHAVADVLEDELGRLLRQYRHREVDETLHSVFHCVFVVEQGFFGSTIQKKTSNDFIVWMSLYVNLSLAILHVVDDKNTDDRLHPVSKRQVDVVVEARVLIRF